MGLNDYIADTTLDGLFGGVAEQEASIGSNPMTNGSPILKSVFAR